jgi:hypothetical protein
MPYWAGLHTTTPRDRIVSWEGYYKIVDMQEQLLRTAGKKAVVWQRLSAGEKCPCMRNDMPMNPHSICYGTGIVGGYKQFNRREIYVYRSGSNEIKIWDEYNNSVQVLSGAVVESDWIDGNSGINVTGDMEWDVKKEGSVSVWVSFNGISWEEVLVGRKFSFPVERFKLRLTNIDSRFEILRIRLSRDSNNWWYFAENPPLRMEQLFRWGIDMQPFDVRVWTIIDEEKGLVLRTGDLLHWLEGYYAGYRYSVVNNRVTQFVREVDAGVADSNSSGILTQILGMRKVKSAEQDYRVW